MRTIGLSGTWSYRYPAYPPANADIVKEVTDYYRDDRNGVRRKRPKGWLDPLPYIRVIEYRPVTLDVVGHFQRSTGYPATTDITGSINCSGYVYRSPPLAPDTLEQRCLTKARLALKGQNVNYSQAWAERKLTSDLVSGNLSKLGDVVDTVVQQNVRKIKRLGKSIVGTSLFFETWLEYQYGWKPLLSDIYGAVADLSDKEELRDARGYVTVEGKASWRDRSVRVVNTDFDGGTVAISLGYDDFFGGKCGLTFEHSNPAFSTAAQLGLTNPLALAWELLPYSFVIDWLLPVGDFFNQLDASIGWKFRSGYYSEIVKTQRSYLGSKVSGYGPGDTGYLNVLNGPNTQTVVSRKVYGSEPVAVIPVPKTFEQGFSPTHVANGIALFMQKFLTGATTYR